MPVLNEQAHVLQSVRRAWAAGVDEVILADGGSTDGTLAAVAGENCQIVRCQRGRAVQQNAGAEVASGEVLLFLHADTWLPPAACEQIRAALADPALEAGFFRQRIEAEGRLYRWLERGNAWRGRRGRPYGDQAMFFRRKTFTQLGGFPSEPFLEDLLLARKFSRRGRFVDLPGPLYVSPRRWQRHGILRQTLRNWTILTAHRFGMSPTRLAQWYRPHSSRS